MILVILVSNHECFASKQRRTQNFAEQGKVEFKFCLYPSDKSILQLFAPVEGEWCNT